MLTTGNMEAVGIFEDTFDAFYISQFASCIVVNHSVVGL